MNIRRAELKRILKREYDEYIVTKKHLLHLIITGGEDLYIWRYMKALRHEEYYQTQNNKLLEMLWAFRKNKYGRGLGIYLQANCAGRGLRIWHSGSIVIHRNAKLGENCQLHGCNCIGNKGVGNSGVPTLGNNINVGYGAVVIGDIEIADDVTIAANAVVIKSCMIKGAMLAGVPAKEI